MKVYIELLIPLLIGLFVILWFVWKSISTKWHNWRYKEQNDRGKKGEEHRQELIRQGLPDPVRTIAKAVNDTGGQGKLERRSDVPPTDTSNARENSDSIGKGSGRRKFFRKQK